MAIFKLYTRKYLANGN